MAEISVHITHFSCAPYQPQKGQLVIGVFDVVVAGVEVSGDCLIRTPKNAVAIAGPSLEKHTTRHCEKFVDSKFAHPVKAKATDVYRLIGGTDLPDWP